MGWSFYRLVFKYLKSKNKHKGNRKKKKVKDLLIAFLKDKEIQKKLVKRADIYTTLVTCTVHCIQKKLYQIQL